MPKKICKGGYGHHTDPEALGEPEDPHAGQENGYDYSSPEGDDHDTHHHIPGPTGLESGPEIPATGPYIPSDSAESLLSDINDPEGTQEYVDDYNSYQEFGGLYESRKRTGPGTKVGNTSPTGPSKYGATNPGPSPFPPPPQYNRLPETGSSNTNSSPPKSYSYSS